MDKPLDKRYLSIDKNVRRILSLGSEIYCYVQQKVAGTQPRRLIWEPNKKQ